MFRSRSFTPRRPCWFRSQATTESGRPVLISSGGTAPKNTNLQNKRPYRCNPDAGIPLGLSPAEVRNISPAPFSPWWVTYRKHEFAKQTALKVYRGGRNSTGTVAGRGSKYLAGSFQFASGRLQKTQICETNSFTSPPPAVEAAFLATLGGKPSGHGSARPYIGRMTRSHRSLPAELQSLGFCDRSLSNLETW